MHLQLLVPCDFVFVHAAFCALAPDLFDHESNRLCRTLLGEPVVDCYFKEDGIINKTLAFVLWCVS